jgi:hypothetical protein
MAVLDPEALDQLRGLVSPRGKLLAHALAQRGRERVDLADGGLRLLHHPIEAGKPSHVGDGFVSKLKNRERLAL